MALRAGNDSGHGVDPAALLGVVLAAVIAIFLPEGPWGPFAIIIGAILCFVILGYYKADLTLQFWRALAQALALGAVGGLCFMILVAYPFQQGWVQDRVEGKCQEEVRRQFPTLQDAHAQNIPKDAGLPLVTPETQEDEIGNCIGNETSSRLIWIWLATGLIIVIVYSSVWSHANWTRLRSKWRHFIETRPQGGKGDGNA